MVLVLDSSTVLKYYYLYLNIQFLLPCGHFCKFVLFDNSKSDPALDGDFLLLLLLILNVSSLVLSK